jgi:cell pole-organizing protein PopZ
LPCGEKVTSRPSAYAARSENADRQARTTSEILALRNKIGKELAGDPDVPRANDSDGMLELSSLRSILGGHQEADVQRPEPPSVPAPPRSAALRSTEPPAYPRSLSSADRSTVAPQPTAFDIPARGAPGFRPPYGNGSFGVRGYSPADPPRGEPGMMSPGSGLLATGAFDRLAEAQRGAERSIDDLARELLRPMLKQWLDQHLPRLVESLVREEIERVARRGGR